MKKRATKTREPSQASLREIPEVDFEHGGERRNPYAARIAAEGIHVRRGRPTKGTETGPTVPRSVRVPANPSPVPTERPGQPCTAIMVASMDGTAEVGCRR